MQRIIKDGQYVKEEYDKNSYLIKSEVSDIDKSFARKEGREDKVLQWNCNLPLIIHSANLLGSEESDFPPILKSQKEVYFLSMPSQLLKKINSASFLNELRGLMIDGGNLRLNENTTFNELLFLSIDGHVSFIKANMPKLRSLSCKYKIEVIEELKKYDIFDKLTLKTVNENIFEKISYIKNLYGLQINRGKLDNINGISSVKSLHWLSLDNLSGLTDLDEIIQLPELEYLQVGYCKNIKNWDFLLELDNLKRLWIPVSLNKELPPQSIIDLLIKKGVEGIRKGY